VQTFKDFEAVLSQINDLDYESIALKLFRFQFEHNKIYRDFVSQGSREPVTSLDRIPFLPISFFKTHDVKTGTWIPGEVFSSSGTTGTTTSRHAVKDVSFYLANTERIFRQFFGALEDFHVLALLPSYLEREGSSLVTMADYFIRKSGSEHSGFYLNNLAELNAKLAVLKSENKKIILLGVTFALLELAEKYPQDLSHCVIMETGGMKGRRKEIIREELHAFLGSSFSVSRIHSEYGMTELLSQGYSLGNGLFKSGAGMKILIRDLNDPYRLEKQGKTGGINVIDLANIYSCAFIETEDLGKVNQDGYFEVLGRMDNSDIRGCNLLLG